MTPTYLQTVMDICISKNYKLFNLSRKLHSIVLLFCVQLISYAQCPPANGTNSAISENLITGNSISIVHWMSDVGAPGAMVFMNKENVFEHPPETLTSIPGPLFINTDYVGAGQQLVSINPMGTAVLTTTNLLANTTYYYRTYPYKECSGTYSINTNDFIDVSFTTCSVKNTLPYDLVFGTPTSTTLNLNSFTTPGGITPQGYIVKVNTINSFTSYGDGASLPTANTVYGGSGEQVVYVGNSNAPNVTITGLLADTRYYVAVIPYHDSCSGNGNYYVPTPYTISRNTSTNFIAATIGNFYNMTGNVSNTAISLSGTTNTGAAISYRLLSQPDVGASISGTTLMPGTTVGTILLEAFSPQVGNFEDTTKVVTITVEGMIPDISGISGTLAEINQSTYITQVDDGAYEGSIKIPYELTAIDPSSTYSFNVDNILFKQGIITAPSPHNAGGIILKYALKETRSYKPRDYYALVSFYNPGYTPKTVRPFRLEDFTIGQQTSIVLPKVDNESTFSSGNASFSIVQNNNSTGSSINGDVFTAGSPGTVTLRVSIPETFTYLATTKDVTVTIVGVDQTIDFPTIPALICGEQTVELSATATSGLEVSYTSNDTSVASINGTTMTIHMPGTVSLTASQAGAGEYNAAPDVVQAYTVTPAEFLEAVDVLTDVTLPGYYELPVLTHGDYFTAPGRTGPQLAVGTQITTTQTIYINNAHATTASCQNESSFTVTILPSTPATALHFDGVTDGTYDYLEVADDDSLDFTDSFTFETWIKFDQVDRTSPAGYSWQGIMGKESFAGPYGLMLYTGVSLTGLPTKTLRFYHAGFDNGYTDFSWSALQANQWNHIAVSLSPTETTIFINGMAVITEAGTGSLVANANPLRIGIGNIAAPSAPYSFGGVMEEVRFWNTARTEAEIALHKDYELTGNETGLVLNYRFNQGNVNEDNTAIITVTDNSLLGNNATLNSFSLTETTSNLVNTALNIQAKIDQILTFDSITGLHAQSGSVSANIFTDAPLEVTITNTNPSVLTLDVDSEILILSAGTTTITASQEGNYMYNPATPIVQVIVVDKADQTISFNALNDIEDTAPDFELIGGASSGLAVTYTSSNPDVASISGTIVNILSAGTTTITASQVGDDNFNSAENVVQNLNVLPRLLTTPKIYLQGATLNSPDDLMRDDLRLAGIIPITSPYTDNLTCNATVFNTTGPNAIVDWVWLELRDKNNNTQVRNSRSALLQRDGDIVDIDGTSPVYFIAAIDNYYITVNHYSHLGIMSASTISLNTTATSIDFSNGSTTTFGNNAQSTFGMPSGIIGLWAGDTNGDGRINYLGALSDIPPIRSQVFNDPNNSLFGGPPVATYLSIGYVATDIDMDGNTVYSGATSDVLKLRNNIFNNASNSVFGGPPIATFVFIQQLPEGASN